MNRRSFFGFMAAGIAAITGIPNISKVIPFVPTTRRLKASWSPELAQDLQTFHGLDAEAELTAIIKQYVEEEIGKEARGTLTLAPIVANEYNIHQQYLFFRNDGKHGPDTFWGLHRLPIHFKEAA